MLQSLYVKNLALVDEAEVEFTNDFNVLTGETGAGKSIIIGSICLALGGKANADMIRNGCDYALVELVFHVDDSDKLNELSAMGIEELSEGDLIISRKITPTRSVCKVNGETFTASQIKKISELLIDIHGQHEHQYLLNEAKHLDVLNSFNEAAANELLQQVNDLYDDYCEVCEKLESFDVDESKRQREISFIEFEVNEINQAELKSGEDDKIEAKYKVMQNSMKITGDIQNALYLLNEAQGNVADNVGSCVSYINNSLRYDEGLSDIHSALVDIDGLVSDVVRSLTQYYSDLEFDDEEFNYIQDRLDVYNNLKMKYGGTVEKVLEYCDKKQAELEELNNAEEIIAKLKIKKQSIEEKLDAVCDKLTKERRKLASRLQTQIVKALEELNFLQVKFEIEFEQLENYSRNGRDKVRFLISTNPGEALKPLKSVASGGEMSRIMLAIKAVLASKEKLDTLIFDEIDSGISGVTAQLVAEKMCQIAQNRQVICISHLSQIAAMADTHFLIEKKADDDVTTTTIRSLNYDESIRELARILGGNHITDAVLKSATEIKKNK